VADEKDFQQRIRRIDERVNELEAIADPAVRSAARELVQLLMELHGSALERMLEITFQSGDAGTRVIDELGQDPLVSSVLVLYGLHPEELGTRVERKLKEIRPRLYKMGAEATLVSVNGSDVRVRVSIEGHACGSTAQNVRAAVEEAIYEAAPDLTSLVVEGLEEPVAVGFVAIDTLLGASSAARRPVATLGSDGMD
jgi:Fe-S cluster biogenesis protein NfuA